MPSDSIWYGLMHDHGYSLSSSSPQNYESSNRGQSVNDQPRTATTRSSSGRSGKNPARILTRRKSILCTPNGSPKRSSPSARMSPLTEDESLAVSRKLSESSCFSEVDDAFEAIFELQENNDLTQHVRDYLSQNIDPVLGYVHSDNLMVPTSSSPSSRFTCDPFITSSTSKSRRGSTSSSLGYCSATEADMEDISHDRFGHDHGMSRLWNLSLHSDIFSHKLDGQLDQETEDMDLLTAGYSTGHDDTKSRCE